MGLAAIRAAIRPAQSEFLYFMRDKKTDKHKFSVTYEEHVGAINSQK
ncbi:endolytic transglycosylase MltG [uncultured Campylobacter sp.]|nr:endolytic transglycosylase MltG [uncultured Campylobacter sp.]